MLLVIYNFVLRNFSIDHENVAPQDLIRFQYLI